MEVKVIEFHRIQLKTNVYVEYSDCINSNCSFTVLTFLL